MVYTGGKNTHKAGETLALAKTFVKNGDELADTAKVVDGIDDIYDATKVANKIDDAYDTAKAVGKKTSVFDNAEEISKKYPIDKYGMFGEKGKNKRNIVATDPVDTSADFYEIIKKGGIEEPLPNGKGVKTYFEDGSRVMYRVTTSSVDSPAVDIHMDITGGPIAPQKIHFVRK